MDFRPCFIAYGSVAPEVGTSYANILWFDTGNATLKRYNGAAWVDLAGAVGATGGGGGPHTHPESDIVGLVSDLAALTSAVAGKAATSHTHVQSDVTGLVAALAGKADAAHTHAQADVTSLVTDLASKQAMSAKGVANGYAGLGSDGKVPAAQLPASGGSSTPVNYLPLLMRI